MSECARCTDPAQEQLYRPSTGREFWLCPGCLTDFGEWLEAGDG